MLGVVGAVLAGFAAFIVHLEPPRQALRRRRESGRGRTSQLSSHDPQEGTAQC